MLATILALLTSDARTSYPWPLCWGNALWGYVAFLKHDATQPSELRQGAVFGLIGSFVLYTMPANLFTNLLVFGRTPTSVISATVIPVHLVCCLAIALCPGNLLFRLLALPIPYAIIDSLGVFDNATTAFNYMEEAFASTGSVCLAYAAAMAVNLAGGVVRHFAYNGYSKGAATFDEKLRANVAYSFAASSLYFWGAVHPCAGNSTFHCLDATRLYEVLPWIAVTRNLWPDLLAAWRSLSGGSKEKAA
tara:strand:- start:11 stop:754 length:744 start_codon:yes stop_codon:yes gene_type:complete